MLSQQVSPWFLFIAMSFRVVSHTSSLSLGRQPGRRITFDEYRGSVNFFMFFLHVVGCPPRLFIHVEQGPATNASWGRRSGGMRSTCPEPTQLMGLVDVGESCSDQVLERVGTQLDSSRVVPTRGEWCSAYSDGRTLLIYVYRLFSTARFHNYRVGLHARLFCDTRPLRYKLISRRRHRCFSCSKRLFLLRSFGCSFPFHQRLQYNELRCPSRRRNLILLLENCRWRGLVEDPSQSCVIVLDFVGANCRPNRLASNVMLSIIPRIEDSLSLTMAISSA